MIKDEPHVVKLHLKADELSKQRCDVLLHLMDVAVGKTARVAILDVERGKLHVQTRVIVGIDSLLLAEAGAFVEMWNDLG